jgi:hypothetical protein
VATVGELKEVIILFDEQGTPTFEYQVDSSYFLGVGVTYGLSAETAKEGSRRRVE